jgi:hypothetical protein
MAGLLEHLDSERIDKGVPCVVFVDEELPDFSSQLFQKVNEVRFQLLYEVFLKRRK